MKKRFPWLSVVLAGLLLAGLTACDSFERDTYRALKIAKVEYDLLQQNAARAFVRGRLAPEQWERFALAGNRFIAAHTLAADLMQSYQRVKQTGPEPSGEQQQQLRQQLSAAMAELPVILADVHALLESFDLEPPPDPPQAR